MKDKLSQRSYATSSPFQVRKAFKFFDREQRARIPIEGFTRALEFLGFQFSEMQNLALFARYDKDCMGEIDYMNFISTAMFYAAIEPDFGSHRNAEDSGRQSESSAVADFDPRELAKLQEVELRKVFQKVCRGRGGTGNGSKLAVADFELLLMALGHYLSQKELEACLIDMGVDLTNGEISFELFFEWWTDSMGVDAIRKKTVSAAGAKSAGGGQRHK